MFVFYQINLLCWVYYKQNGIHLNPRKINYLKKTLKRNGLKLNNYHSRVLLPVTVLTIFDQNVP